MMENEKEISEINKIFDISINEQDISAEIEDVLEWDSYNVLLLMSYIEETYQVQAALYDIIKLETIEDMIQFLRKVRKG